MAMDKEKAKSHSPGTSRIQDSPPQQKVRGKDQRRSRLKKQRQTQDVSGSKGHVRLNARLFTRKCKSPSKQCIFLRGEGKTVWWRGMDCETRRNSEARSRVKDFFCKLDFFRHN